MKTIKIIIVLIGLLTFSGCIDSFSGGVATGVALQELADRSQDELVIAIKAMDAEAERINNAVEGVEGSVLIRPETLDAVKGLKGREKDPVAWAALASILVNAFLGGKGYTSRIAKK
jgi:hypothetical protein